METPLKETLQKLDEEGRLELVKQILQEGEQSKFGQLVWLVIEQCLTDAQETLALQHGRDGAANAVFIAGLVRGLLDLRARVFPPKDIETDEVLNNG